MTLIVFWILKAELEDKIIIENYHITVIGYVINYFIERSSLNEKFNSIIIFGLAVVLLFNSLLLELSLVQICLYIFENRNVR